MFSPQKFRSLALIASGQKTESNSEQGLSLKANPRSPNNGQTSAEGKPVACIGSDGIMDPESLSKRISKLENELFEYQYNMGLLLIEKKEWASQYEEIRKTSVEIADALEKEQEAHSITMSEVETREENLKKALGVERQCVLELEKALREIRSEYAEIKFNADSKLSEANALVASVEEKSWQIEAKFLSADTKLAEVSRKSSEMERKFHEFECQESLLHRERFSFITERETRETYLSKKKEDLREWEQKLQELEEKLADGRRLLNQREERANENDMILTKKQSDIEELQEKIEAAHSSLKSKEDHVGIKLANLAIKEKEADYMQKKLEVKEIQLLQLQESLNTRERLEIQKLLDEHKTLLAKKQEEFDLELEQKRGLHDEQLKDKAIEVEKKAAEIVHVEEKVKKREQAIEKKIEKVKQKDMDLELKSNALKEKEKLLKVEEKSLKEDRKLMSLEKEGLLGMKAELVNLRAGIEEQIIKLNQEKEQLKLTEDERLEHTRLRSELKEEIKKCRLQSEQVMKEADELKQEKENFEREWEELDEKRAKIKKELEDALDQEKCLEKLRQSEEEKLNNEKRETQQYIQRELESLKLAKDSFNANMELEKSLLAENYQSEKGDLLRDFELQKQEFETEMQMKQEVMESRLLEREKKFTKERVTELNNISYLRETAEREIEEMKLERLGIDKEKLEISQIKKNVEAQQLEMQKDIKELLGLSQRVKDQRELFVKERERFLAFVEKQKSCNICRETICEFMLSDLQPLVEVKILGAPPLPRREENHLEVAEGTSERLKRLTTLSVDSRSPGGGGSGTMSWLRKCTSRIFNLSPAKKLVLDSAQDASEASSFSIQPLPSSEKGPESSIQVASDSFDVQILGSDSDVREFEPLEATSGDQNVLDAADNTQKSDLKAHRRRTSKRVNPRASRKRAKTIIGQSTDHRDSQDTNGNAINLVHTNDDNQVASGVIETTKNRRKRNHVHVSQATNDHGEDLLDTVKDGDRRKRRQGVASQPSNVEKRYNLRQSWKSVAMISNGSLTEISKGEKEQRDDHAGKESQLPNFGTNPAQNVEIGVSLEEIHEDGDFAGFMLDDGIVAVRNVENIRNFPADNPEGFNNAGKTLDGHTDSENTSVANMVISEEANISAEARDNSDEDFDSMNHEEKDDNDSNDGNGDEVDHPGEVSVGKKIWNFLTT